MVANVSIYFDTMHKLFGNEISMRMLIVRQNRSNKNLPHSVMHLLLQIIGRGHNKQ